MPKWEHLHAERGLYDLHVLNELPASWVVARVWRNDAPHTAVFTVVVRPAISVPPRWNEEMLPVGMQFAARFGAESTLLRLAGQLERAQPWFDKLPPGLPY